MRSADEDVLWAQLADIDLSSTSITDEDSAHALGLCIPPLYVHNRLTREIPTTGPFYLVTEGLNPGVYTTWCAIVVLWSILFTDDAWLCVGHGHPSR